MLLNLSQIHSAHERYEKVYPGEAFAGDDTVKVAAPVALEFDIFKDKAQFRLVGRVQTALELPCVRCLEPFTWPIDSPFDLRYQPRTENAGWESARLRKTICPQPFTRGRRSTCSS